MQMDGVLQRRNSRYCHRALFERLCEHMNQVRHERITIEGEHISYAPDEFGNVGVYVAADPLTPECNYFEIEVIDPGVDNNIVVGLVSPKHPLDQCPGWIPESIGFHLGEGSLYRESPKGVAFGPMCEAGDFIGVGIKRPPSSQGNRAHYSVVFFSNNGKEFGTAVCGSSTLHPAVGLHSAGAEVRLSLGARWAPDDDLGMCVDSGEDEWARLHDIRLNGAVLEYTGRGKSIIDVGLAQAKYPLDTTYHYFEIEILDPGKNCYIAIGLARKDYPKYRHPGWNRGSIAYHADDGKLFAGSGVGDPFGPRCYRGDVMGCGIIFPRDFAGCGPELEDDFGSFSESEDEEWGRENMEAGPAVQVFFTRNGKTVGRRDVCIPRGGFYPTVGMLSGDERVKVDLHPLTG